MHRFTRKEWGARPAKAGPGKLDPARVEGLALHWPGDSVRRGTVDAVKAALKSWQNYHIDGRGWSDIAYQEAIDQLGNSYQLRGFRTQSGANGDTDVNERFGAILLVLAIGEEPSEAMLATLRRRVTRFRHVFPGATKVVGHSAIRPEPTDCPGDKVRAAIPHLFKESSK